MNPLTLTPIFDYDTIGDSLPTLNLNFGKLDDFTYNLNISANDLFKPLMDFYVFYKDNLNSMITTVQANSSKWEDLRTLVTANSSAWITPITYIDPSIHRYPILDTTYNAIISSFKALYPVLADDGTPIYTENQKAIIYYYVNDIKDTVNDKIVINSDTINCVSEGYKSASINCTNHVGKNDTKCRGDNWSCKGCKSSCDQSVTVSCTYPENHSSQTTRYLQASVQGIFQDIYEKQIKSVIFTVQNCDWIFERNLT